MAIAWSDDNKVYALLGIELSSMSASVVVSETVHSPKELMVAMEISGSMLFINNMSGLVTIYRVPAFEKVGCLMFNNLVQDMVISTTSTQTGISLNNLLVLEKIEGNRPGSLQIFLIPD